MTKTIIIKDNISEILPQLQTLFFELSDVGSLFIVCSNQYDENGIVLHDFFDVINKGISCGFVYVNTIVYPTNDKQNVCFQDNIRYVVWLCKDATKYSFDKDLIREKHIWKDVEWGKRAKNYNEKGKDPGNVWIPTEDDGKANITCHRLLKDEDVIEKLLIMTNALSDNIVINNQIAMANQSNRSNRSNEINNREAIVFFASSESMEAVDDKSITTVVTSPPYWNLKDYFKSGQIGQESYDMYISRMRNVWNECYKKLDNNGTLWININIRVQDRKPILIPHDIINSCKELGFFYKGIIIWHKSSGIPASKRNLRDNHEYILIFSKQKDFAISKDMEGLISDYKNDAINYGGFWNINRKAGSVGKKYIHPAIYPNELVRRIVLISSNKGNFILDPFLGSGTSLISSVNEDRSFIGFEYNEGFKDLMEDRFSQELQKQIKIRYI